MCMFSFWHQKADKLAPALGNPNFNPKNTTVETSPFGVLGYGRWTVCGESVRDALEWVREPWELVTGTDRSEKASTGDPLTYESAPYCGSSTDLSMLGNQQYDLVITDPPFGDNLYYADLSDFFYV